MLGVWGLSTLTPHSQPAGRGRPHSRGLRTRPAAMATVHALAQGLAVPLWRIFNVTRGEQAFWGGFNPGASCFSENCPPACSDGVWQLGQRWATPLPNTAPWSERHTAEPIRASFGTWDSGVRTPFCLPWWQKVRWGRTATFHHVCGDRASKGPCGPRDRQPGSR